MYITVPGFEKKSKQELFDITLQHVRKTRTKSVAPSGGCCYAGVGCAAAPFLKEDKRAVADALAEEDNSEWLTLAERGMVPEHEHAFVHRLQDCHDRSPYGDGFMEEFELRMRSLAQREGLRYE